MIPATATFTLQCCGCNMVEDRPAAECKEQPYCKVCYMPMFLKEVTVKNTRTKKARP